jgi:hypothetical protein
MLYMHDVWVNWFEEDNPHLVPYFHEWIKGEKVGLMDQIPLIKVNTKLYNYITFGSNEISEVILSDIENKGYHRKNHERVVEKYTFVCSDGNGVMAIILDNNGNVKKKSRLIPRQFQLVHEMISFRENNYELEEKIDISNYELYLGMTRQEKIVATNVIKFISNLIPENIGLLKYLMSEWDINIHRELINDNFDEIKNKLLEDVKMTNDSKLIKFNKIIDNLKVIN